MKVVVTGATGLLGQKLVAKLKARGDTVVALSRDGTRASAMLGIPAISADLESAGPWQAELANVDAVVHLAGESIGGKRWDARQKQALRDSRVESTGRIVEALTAMPSPQRPKALICASGADYYPFADSTSSFDDDAVDENQPAGDHFLARLCRDWEREALAAAPLGVRVVTMRTGIVLDYSGGALAKLLPVFKLGAGGKLGSGDQWFSWIHIDDAVAAYLFVLDHDLTGPCNVVAASVRQADFAKALGRAVGRPALVPTPGFALKLAVGAEFAEYLLRGRHVVPRALTAAGFAFRYPDLASALAAK